MKLRSVHHLIEVIVNKVSGCNAVIRNISVQEDRMWFDVWCESDDSIFEFFLKNSRKYNISIYETYLEKKQYIVRCYAEGNHHPQLFQNYENIVNKYHNAQNAVSLHKRELDAKIEHYKQVLWKKHQSKFANEMKNVELAKFDIYLQYGIDTIKLD